MESTLLLAAIAQRFRLEPVPGPPVELQPSVTLRPRHGIRLRLRRRDRRDDSAVAKILPRVLM